MTLFIFSSVLSACLFFLTFRRIMFVNTTNALGETSARKAWLRCIGSAIVGAVTIITILLLYYYVRIYHLDPILRKDFDRITWFIAFEGTGLRKIVFGLIFGVFFAYWVGFIFEGDNKGHSFQDIVIGAIAGLVLIIFLFIGLGGEEAIEGIATRITGVTLPGGAELKLAQQAPGDVRSGETSLYTLVPPSKSDGSRPTAPDVSGGLTIWSDLDGAIGRDARYFALQKKLILRNGNSVNPSIEHSVFDDLKFFQKSHSVFRKYFSALGDCLQEFFDRDADEVEIGNSLSDFGRALRNYLNSGATNTSKTGSKYSNIFASVIVERFTRFPVFLGAQAAIHSNEKQQCGGLPDSIQSRQLSEYLQDESRVMAWPYMWSAAAASLAFSHNYTAAITLLDRWLRLSEPKNDQALRKIFEIRMRSLLASFVEEWLSYQPLAKTQPVLAYQEQNLRKAIELAEINSTDTRVRMGSRAAPDLDEDLDAEENCDQFSIPKWSRMPEPLNQLDGEGLSVGNMELSLVATLISLKWTWIDVVLASENYYKSHSFTAQRFADELAEMKLGCLRLVVQGSEADPSGKHFVALQRAQALEAFARVTRANALLVAQPEEKKWRLEVARRAARNGLSLVTERAEDQRHCQHLNALDDKTARCTNSTENIWQYSQFVQSISGTPAIKVADRITETLQQLERELGR